ncbi:MAG: translocation/assembly module TamB domain-containing protein, partial [Acidobacteria bacterium]|nr:translocation/assembly module TamB domain-containing protein [Acidobacteriota bacterium]
MLRWSGKWKVALAAGAIIAAAAVFLAFYLWQLAPLDRYLQAQIIQYLQSNYPVKVQIASTHLDLKGRRLFLRGLQIQGELFPAPSPPVSVEEIEIQFVYRVWNRLFYVRDVFIRRPSLQVREDPNHLFNITNLFKPRAGEGSAARISLASSGNFAIEGGTLRFGGQSFPLETQARNIRARLQHRPADPDYHFEFDADQLALGNDRQTLKDARIEADFGLENETIIFRRFLARSDLGRFDSGQGRVNYHTLQYEFRGSGQISLARAARAGFRAFNQPGTLRLDGNVMGRGRDFDFSGTMAADQLQFRQYFLTEVVASGHANLSQVEMDEVQGRFLGGRFAARLSLGMKTGLESEAAGEIHSVRIESGLAALGIPFPNTAGETRLKFQLRWPALDVEEVTGTISADYSGRLTAAAPNGSGGAPAESIPYQGSAAISQAGGRLRIDAAAAVTPHSRLQASGSVTLDGDYDLKLQLRTDSGNEWLLGAGLLDAAAGRHLQQREVKADAGAEFDGSLSGKKRSFRLAGRLTAQEMRVNQIQLAGVRSRVEWTPRFLELDDASMQFGGSAMTGSFRYPLAQQEPLEADLVVRNAQIAELLSVLNRKDPVRGILNARIRARGRDLQSVEGASELTLDKPVIYGESFDRITASVALRGRQFAVENLRISKGPGSISGSASGGFGSRTLELNLTGRGISLASVQAANFSQYGAAGALSFTLKGSGSLENLGHTLHAEISSLVVRGERLEPLVVDASAKGQRVDFTARTTVQTQILEARGNVLIRGDYPFQAALDLRNAPLRPYLALFRQDPPVSLRGLATGRLEAHGTLGRFRDVAVEAKLSTLQLAVDQYQLRNHGEVQLRYAGGKVEIRPLRMIGPETSLNFAGTVSTGGTQSIDLTVAGSANLLVLAWWVPDLNAGGKVDLNVYMEGAIRQPKILGTVAFEKVYAARPEWPTPLFDVTGEMRFTANQVSLQSVTAKTRYGQVQAEGGMFLEGWTPTRGRINITGNDLHVEYPENTKCVVDADVDFLRTPTNQLLSGVLYIRDAEYARNISLADLIAQVTTYRALPPARAFGRRPINLDLEVEGYKTLRIQNNLADVIGSGVFSVRGTADRPMILGRLNVDEGRLIFQDSKYEITRGGINFNNPREP